MNKLSDFKRKGPPKVITIQCRNCGMDKSVPASVTYRRYCDLACLKMAREKKKGVDINKF